MWYRFSISARCSSSTPFGQPGGAAGVHQHHGVGLLRLGRHDRVAGVDELLVADVVGHVAVADQHDVAQRQVGADLGDVAAK